MYTVLSELSAHIHSAVGVICSCTQCCRSYLLMYTVLSELCAPLHSSIRVMCSCVVRIDILLDIAFTGNCISSY